VAALPWMRGGRWRSPDGEGVFGSLGEHASRFTHHDLELEFHTQVQLSPALFLHMRLLSQVVGEFYEGKRREAALRRHAYLQAVHETGARLTHDVKNLLQSLYTLTTMAAGGENAGYAGLLQRQLPELTKRLHATLEKLQSPEVERSELALCAREWWAGVQKRLAGSGVELRATLDADGDVPSSLFDSFVENTLENARTKAEREPGIAISLELRYGPGEVEVRVCDTGSAVPDAIAARLLREPVERGSGLGIGLYHTARLATQSGYHAALAENRDGLVCFTLRRGLPPPAAE
jgi:signal transduction histidine kinase